MKNIKISNIGITTLEEKNSIIKFILYLQQELPEIIEFINEHMEHDKKVYDIRDASIIKKALNIAVVISYIRPFTECKGFFKNETVMNILKKDYNKTEKKLHKKLCDARHQEFAHADQEKIKVYIHDELKDSIQFEKIYDYDDLLSSYSTYSMIATRQLLTDEELNLLLDMIIKILNTIAVLLESIQEINFDK